MITIQQQQGHQWRWCNAFLIGPGTSRRRGYTSVESCKRNQNFHAALKDKGQADIDDVLNYFGTCATTAITEEKYFPSTIHRDAAIVDICHAATKVLTVSGVTMQNWELPCLFNGSGAGKTFVNFNSKSLVRAYLDRHKDDFVALRNSFTHCFRIFLKQVTGLSYNDFCQNLGEYVAPSINLYFKWFTASQLLLPQDDVKLHRPQISQFGVAMKHLHNEGFLAKIDYSVVFAALRQKHNINANAPIWIFVAHDEMQFLTSYSTLLNLKEKPDQDAKRATILYQYLMESLKFTQTAKEFGIHVLNMYSGTFRLDITTILEATGYRWRSIRMEPLTVEDGVVLLSAKHPDLADKMNTPLFKQALSHLGNIPRIWRLFSEVIARRKNPSLNATNLWDLNEQLKAEVKGVYGREEQFELLLLLAIQGWTFAEASKILPKETLLHTNELQNAGLLFLVDERYFVPPILLRSLTSDFQARIKQILADFPDSMLAGYFTPANFEEFCVGFFTLKCNLLVSQGVYTIPLTEFFKGAWISPPAQNLTLTLATDNPADVVLHKTLHATLDSLERVTTRFGKVLNVLNPLQPVALWIGNADQHQDAVLLLPDTLIQFEMKYTSADAQQALTGTSSSSFESEQEKAENSPLRLVDKKNIFVYATNCRMTNDVQKRAKVQHDGSIIICSETFSKVFSPTFEYVTSQIKSLLMVPIENATPTVEINQPEETHPQQEGLIKKGSQKGLLKATPKANKAQARKTRSKDTAEKSKKRKRDDDDSSEEKARVKKKTKPSKK